MLLRQITLKNIRSYCDETIVFPEGSILLSGDIGCGKSSLLLSTEFALFGASRPDLPAESLLRKGCTSGSVELTFLLKGQEITIGRNLRKDRDSIKQTSGYFIINNQKKELTPVELKAEIISLLGYPEDVLAKNKNYIFRYTVYTPQEEMKLILQEDAEIRLDVLRKIFNIDKYKNIRENLQSYLRQMRQTIEIMKVKIEPLDEIKQQLSAIQQEKENIAKAVLEIASKAELARQAILTVQQEIEAMELQQRRYLELRQQKQTIEAILEEKQRQWQGIFQKQQEIAINLSKILPPQGMTLDKIKQEMHVLKEQQEIYLTQKTILQEKIRQIQARIDEIQREAAKNEEFSLLLSEKERYEEQLTAEVDSRHEWEEKKKQLEELAEKTISLIVKNKTILSQAREIDEKIGSLETCPTCLQIVPEAHRHAVKLMEQEKIGRAENFLHELYEKKAEILTQKENIHLKIEEIAAKRTILARTTAELQQLREKIKQLAGQKDILCSFTNEKNVAMQHLNELQQKINFEIMESKLSRLREIEEMFLQRNFLENHAEEIAKQGLKIKQEISALNIKLESVMRESGAISDGSEAINAKKKVFHEATERERELSLRQMQLQTQNDVLIKQEQSYEQTIHSLALEKSRLLRQKELHHWLEEYFINLTYTIEKHVMATIHLLFNQFFQEWFSILIDDENVSSRLDDSFTPVIEQNGHEMLFFNLSGGEKTSAALAYRLALNRVINDVIREINTKEIIIFDEPTDGFSMEQLDKVKEVLDKLHLQQTIIVSHESKIESFVENVIRIEKHGHTSRAVIS